MDDDEFDLDELMHNIDTEQLSSPLGFGWSDAGEEDVGRGWNEEEGGLQERRGEEGLELWGHQRKEEEGGGGGGEEEVSISPTHAPSLAPRAPDPIPMAAVVGTVAFPKPRGGKKHARELVAVMGRLSTRVTPHLHRIRPVAIAICKRCGELSMDQTRQQCGKRVCLACHDKTKALREHILKRVRDEVAMAAKCLRGESNAHLIDAPQPTVQSVIVAAEGAEENTEVPSYVAKAAMSVVSTPSQKREAAEWCVSLLDDDVQDRRSTTLLGIGLRPASVISGNPCVRGMHARLNNKSLYGRAMSHVNRGSHTYAPMVEGQPIHPSSSSGAKSGPRGFLLSTLRWLERARDELGGALQGATECSVTERARAQLQHTDECIGTMRGWLGMGREERGGEHEDGEKNREEGREKNREENREEDREGDREWRKRKRQEDEERAAARAEVARRRALVQKKPRVLV